MEMKITITLNSGKELVVEVESYNASELAALLNDPHTQMINIGDVILGRHSIMMIAPYEAHIEETPVA